MSTDVRLSEVGVSVLVTSHDFSCKSTWEGSTLRSNDKFTQIIDNGSF